MVLSKVAAVAAMCIALFPCNCGGNREIVKYVHGTAAAVMFVILAVFCYIFFRRSLGKGETQAKSRAVIYAGCGVIIVAAVLVLALDHFTDGGISSSIPRLTFYGEMIALLAFGVSWLTASHYLPVLTSKGERLARRQGT